MVSVTIPTKTVTKTRAPMVDRSIRDLVKTLYLQGLKPAVIERETGVKPVTQRAWKLRYKWSDLAAKSEAILQRTATVTLVRQSANAVSSESAKMRSKLGAVLVKQAEALESASVTLTDVLNTPARQGLAAATKTLADAAATVFDWGADSRGSGLLLELGESEPGESSAVEVESSVVSDEPAPELTESNPS